eukprot:Gb_23758 [translate_table: standard]
MEKKSKIVVNRPVSSARDRPEFGFSILEKGVSQRNSGAHWFRKQLEDQPKGFVRSSSFCGRPFSHGEGEKGSEASKLKRMRRPKTHPELLHRGEKPVSERSLVSETRPHGSMKKLQETLAFNSSKLLVNVTVLQSIGALRVLLPEDTTVHDVIKAALVLYAKEGRRPLLSTDPTSFGLHYSQFCMDSLNPKDRIRDLGSRNFFLCPKTTANSRITSLQSAEAPVSSCGKEMDKISRISYSWCRVMDCFLLLP